MATIASTITETIQRNIRHVVHCQLLISFGWAGHGMSVNLRGNNLPMAFASLSKLTTPIGYMAGVVSPILDAPRGRGCGLLAGSPTIGHAVSSDCVPDTLSNARADPLGFEPPLPLFTNLRCA